MDSERTKHISPIVDYYWPDLSDRAKAEMTAALRPYFRAQYAVYCRMDRDGLLGPDSPESKCGGRLGVV